MSKDPKWRVGVTISSHHVVELEAPSGAEACNLAMKRAHDDRESYLTGYSGHITSLLVNDREARNFACYVPEFYDGKKDEKPMSS